MLFVRRSSSFQNFLRKKGVQIGEGNYIYPGNAAIDITRPSLVKIGSNCFDYARSIYERYNRRPGFEEMTEEFIWFVSGDEVNNYPTLPIKRQLGPTYNAFVTSHKAKYKNFDDFLTAGIE